MEQELTHHIDRHIVKVLTYNESARYRDLRPEHTDSNLFNYHRKMLVQQGYIKQNPDKTYSLAYKGYRLAEKANFETMKTRERPKLSVLFLLTNSVGHLAVWKKAVQPFINTINLPNGKIRLEDQSIIAASKRMLAELTPEKPKQLALKGVAEVTVIQGDVLIAHTINMVVAATISPAAITSSLIEWVDPKLVGVLEMTPGVKEICADFLDAAGQANKSYLINI